MLFAALVSAMIVYMLAFPTPIKLSFYCDFSLHDVENMLNAIKINEMKVRRYPTI